MSRTKFSARYASADRNRVEEVERNHANAVTRVINADLTPRRDPIGRWVFFHEDNPSLQVLQNEDNFAQDVDLAAVVAERRERERRSSSVSQSYSRVAASGARDVGTQRPSIPQLSGPSTTRGSWATLVQRGSGSRSQVGQRPCPSSPLRQPSATGTTLQRHASVSHLNLAGSRGSGLNMGQDLRRSNPSLSLIGGPGRGSGHSRSNLVRATSSNVLAQTRPTVIGTCVAGTRPAVGREAAIASASNAPGPSRASGSLSSPLVAEDAKLEEVIEDNVIALSLKEWSKSEKVFCEQFTSKLKGGRKQLVAAKLERCGGKAYASVKLSDNINLRDNRHYARVLLSFCKLGRFLNAQFELNESRDGYFSKEGSFSFEMTELFGAMRKSLVPTNYEMDKPEDEVQKSLYHQIARNVLEGGGAKTVQTLMGHQSSSVEVQNLKPGDEISVSLFINYSLEAYNFHEEMVNRMRDRFLSLGFGNFELDLLVPGRNWFAEHGVNFFTLMNFYLPLPLPEQLEKTATIKGLVVPRSLLVKKCVAVLLNNQTSPPLPPPLKLTDCYAGLHANSVLDHVASIIAHHRSLLVEFFPEYSIQVFWQQPFNSSNVVDVAKDFAERTGHPVQQIICLLHRLFELTVNGANKIFRKEDQNRFILDEYAAFHVAFKLGMLSVNGICQSWTEFTSEPFEKVLRLKSNEQKGLFGLVAERVVCKIHGAEFMARCKQNFDLVCAQWAFERSGDYLTHLLLEDMTLKFERVRQLVSCQSGEAGTFAPGRKGKPESRDDLSGEGKKLPSPNQLVCFIVDYERRLNYRVANESGIFLNVEDVVVKNDKGNAAPLQNILIDGEKGFWIEKALYKLKSNVEEMHSASLTFLHVTCDYPVVSGILCAIMQASFKTQYYQLPKRILDWNYVSEEEKSRDESLEKVFELAKLAFFSRGGFLASCQLKRESLSVEDQKRVNLFEWQSFMEDEFNIKIVCILLSVYCNRVKVDLRRCLKEREYRCLIKFAIHCSRERFEQINVVIERLSRVENIVEILQQLGSKEECMTAFGFSQTEYTFFEKLFVWPCGKSRSLLKMSRSGDPINFGTCSKICFMHLYPYQDYGYYHFMVRHFPPHVLLEPIICLLRKPLYEGIEKYVKVDSKKSRNMVMDIIANHQLALAICYAFGDRNSWSIRYSVQPWIQSKQAIICFAIPVPALSAAHVNWDFAQRLTQAFFAARWQDGCILPSCYRPFEYADYFLMSGATKMVAESKDPWSVAAHIYEGYEKKPDLDKIKYPDISKLYKENSEGICLLRIAPKLLCGNSPKHLYGKNHFRFSNPAQLR